MARTLTATAMSVRPRRLIVLKLNPNRVEDRRMDKPPNLIEHWYDQPILAVLEENSLNDLRSTL
jgi:hypothetical protein